MEYTSSFYTRIGSLTDWDECYGLLRDILRTIHMIFTSPYKWRVYNAQLIS